MQNIQTAATAFRNQVVIIRCNFDVPLDHGQVGDTTRIEAALPTLKLLRQSGARLLLLAHAGRPDGAFEAQSSLQPIAPLLESLLQEPVALIPYQPDFHQIRFLPDKPIQLLDNLRFYPQEEAHDLNFAQFLAALGSAYVNEAFANCHRHHTSMVELPQTLAGHAYAGLSLFREITTLNRVTQNPERPLVVVIGGAKLETKMPLVTAFAVKADQVLVGGKIAGELKSLPNLPPNVVIAQLNADGKDITPASAQQFAQIIQAAKTVIWNGTLGLFADATNKIGTTLVAQAINTTAAYTVVGGGDTEAALTELILETGIDYISTGGGAMLTYLSEGHLVGVDALG